ncbi:MAG: PAS domain-containing protein [Deltaproteobacteria bacterium]|nr:PAS domain-containing protein [Deltaproteobacteria bacterium]
MASLPDLLRESETRIAHRVITRARERGFGPYVPSLERAWLAAVAGLTQAIACAWSRDRRPRPLPARGPPEGEAVAWAAEESRRHRERGMALPMFLGLVKLYREVVLEVAGDDGLESSRAVVFLQCFFDAVEIAAVAQWTAPEPAAREAELAGAARRLTLEKEKLAALFESIPHPVLLVEPDGYLSGMNDAAARLFLGGEERSGGALLRAPAWLARRIQPVLAGARAKTSFEEELPVGRGRRRYEVSAERILDVIQKFDGAVVWLEDVTEKRRMEARLQAAERLASLGTLAAGVAHEVANPLASVLSGLSHLARELDDLGAALPREAAADLRETIDDARSAAGRVTRIVRAMQDLAGEQGEGLEPALVAPPLRAALRALEPRLGPVSLAAQIGDLPPVLAREELLEQVFANLLERALRAAGEGGRAGRVRVAARAEGEEVRIEIADDGRPLPAEARRRAFDPSVPVRDGGGSALGLSLCHAAVTAFGGTISLGDAPGGGTLASVALRAALLEAPGDPPAGAVSGEAVPAPLLAGGEARPR